MFKRQREWILLLSLFLFMGCSNLVDKNKDDVVVSDTQDTTVINKEYIPSEELALEIYEYIEDAGYLVDYDRCYIRLDTPYEDIAIIYLYKGEYTYSSEFEIKKTKVEYTSKVSDNTYHIATYENDGLIHEVGYTFRFENDDIWVPYSSETKFVFTHNEDNTLQVSSGTPPDGLEEVLEQHATPYWEFLDNERNRWNNISEEIASLIQQKYLDYRLGIKEQYILNDTQRVKPEVMCSFYSCEYIPDDIKKLTKTTGSLSGFNESFSSTEELVINEDVASQILETVTVYSDYIHRHETQELQQEGMILFTNIDDVSDRFYISNSDLSITPDGYMGTRVVKYIDYFNAINTLYPNCNYAFDEASLKNDGLTATYDSKNNIIQLGMFYGDVGYEGSEDGIPSQYILDYEIDGDIITVHSVRYTRDYTYGPSIKDRYGNTYLFYKDKKEHEVVLENQDKLIHETIILKDIGKDYYQVLSFTLE